MRKGVIMDFENNVYAFIKELDQFDYTISYLDRYWRIIFPDKKNKWYYIHITKYQADYYISLINDELSTLEVTQNRSVKFAQSFGGSRFGYHSDEEKIAIWNELITLARNWFKRVKKDWIKTNKLVQINYPLNNRLGIVSHSLVRASLNDMYRIDEKLGKQKTKQFIKLVESNYFHDKKNSTKESMSANDFFAYCKIAYIAAQERKGEVDEKLSGREMYKRYADGRHEGLLDIDPASEQEFSDWIDGKHPKSSRGGHPWEIKRGGNTTHIDLSVSRPSLYEKEGFEITLRGAAIGRLKETICMFLAIYKANLPITIANPEGIRKRLLAQDNIGIIPCYDSLHRANQLFDEDDAVFDVLHFDDFGRYKTRIKPFVTWKPLSILKAKDIF